MSETPTQRSIHLAAQAWCQPETSGTVMDPALATAFARILDAERHRVQGPDDGGPAFPYGEHGTRLGGMTMRDCFAISIAQGELASQSDQYAVTDAKVNVFAARVWRIADALLAARQPRPEEPVYMVRLPDTVDRVHYGGRFYRIPEDLVRP